MNLGTRNSPGGVPLAGNYPHQDREQQLVERSDKIRSMNSERGGIVTPEGLLKYQ
jgi:hypothetical protein